MKQVIHRLFKVLTIGSLVVGLGLMLTVFDSSSYDLGGLALSLVFLVSPAFAILTVLASHAEEKLEVKYKSRPGSTTSNPPTQPDNTYLYFGICSVALGMAFFAGLFTEDNSLGAGLTDALLGIGIISGGIIMMVVAARKSK